MNNESNVLAGIDNAIAKHLYIVATPLGNLRDISLRALDILASVDIIACESLARSKNLLREYGIQPQQLVVCQAGNEAASAEGLVKLLKQGHSIAYISDAGTPGISDPGTKLVARVKQAGFVIKALPGPSALTLIASLAGYPCKPLAFIGFLSTKNGRRRLELQHWLEQEHCFVLYESPFRIISTLKELASLAPKRKIFLGREMTKKSEQFLSGTSDYILSHLEAVSFSIRGEFTLFIAAESV